MKSKIAALLFVFIFTLTALAQTNDAPPIAPDAPMIHAAKVVAQLPWLERVSVWLADASLQFPKLALLITLVGITGLLLTPVSGIWRAALGENTQHPDEGDWRYLACSTAKWLLGLDFSKIKKVIALIALLLVPVLLVGCTSTDIVGKFKTKRLFANLEFAKATVDTCDTDATGKTNHFEHWQIEGLKSDMQRALETAEKGFALAEKLVGNSNTNTPPVAPATVNAPPREVNGFAVK